MTTVGETVVVIDGESKILGRLIVVCAADAKLQSQLEDLDAEIKATARKVDEAEAEAKKAATDRDRDYWRDEKKQLRDKEKQLRDKEQLLLQVKLLPASGVLSPGLPLVTVPLSRCWFCLLADKTDSEILFLAVAK
jgi:seryl-tRNA synthetase